MEAAIKNIKPFNKLKIVIISALIVMISVIAGFEYWQITSSRIYIEKAEISAPQIVLSPSAPGVLSQLMVREGDVVSENQIVAQVGDELIKTKSPGLVIKASDNSGKLVNPGEAVVTIINPDSLRVIGHIDEDNGLKDIQIGKRAIFQVDAFDSKEFSGVVDEISETANSSGVAFSISDKRAKKQFDVKVRFNLAQYQELKNGMSAKLWIYYN